MAKAFDYIQVPLAAVAVAMIESLDRNELR